MNPFEYNETNLTSLGDIKNAIASSKDPFVAVDTETTGLEWALGARAFAVAVAWDNQFAYLHNSEYGKENLKTFLDDVYALDHKTIIMHNAEFDIHMIRETYGVQPLPTNLIDTLRLAYIMNTSADHSLKGWGVSEFGPRVGDGERVVAEYKKYYKLKDYSQIPTSVMAPYAQMDVAMTKSLAEKYNEAVKRESSSWHKYEHSLIPVLVDMSFNGIKLDIDYIEQERSKLRKERYDISKQIFQKIGKAIKIGSVPELSKFFYQRMNITPPLDDKGEQKESTDDPSLKRIISMADEYPMAAEVAQMVLDWRKREKRLSTYLDVYLEKNVNGFIHPNFNATGTLTGRLSGSKPNTQNIPRDKNIRKAFIPHNGILYEFDYSQLEYRLAGVSANEPVIIQAYQQGIDFHKIAASLIFSKPIEQITEEERYIGKTVNFLSMYGGGGGKLAEELNKKDEFNMTVDECYSYINEYRDSMPALRDFNKTLMGEAVSRNVLYTRLGRKINIYDRPYAALNYVIQGTGGDMIKLSLIRVHNLLKGTGAKMRNTVHDSIMIDEIEPSLIPEIVRAMESYTFESPDYGVMPMEIGIKECPKSWGEGVELKGERLAEVLAA